MSGIIKSKKKYRTSEERSFVNKVKKIEPKIQEITHRVTNDKEVRKELLQEAWIYLWEKKERFNDKPISYLLRSCYYKFIDYFKQGKSIDSKPRETVSVISLNYKSCERDIAFEFNISSQIYEPISILIAKDLKERIKKLLDAKLKETYDLLLKGYTIREIAKKFNLTHEAVRLRVKKIRKITKDYLEKLGF
ncbi:sigma-70 family RNA polymerase sigma factor [Candidatus Aerophobetes bacterium]|nr:sigma-70 family RNA polymerase sigma factor [Candidatus Aerophobetes bacterium]